MKLAQSTSQMDWSNLEMVVYAASATSARGLVCLPSDNVLHPVEVTKRDANFALAADPLGGKATITVRPYSR
jgi:alpha-D-xyloside xylohydrolase